MAGHWKKLLNLTSKMVNNISKGSVKLSTSPSAFDSDKGSSRRMKFPYTLSAKIAQFPWMYYAKNNWVYRYYFISVFLCIPIFKKIEGVFNSPANKKKWADIKRKEAEEEHHRH